MKVVFLICLILTLSQQVTTQQKPLGYDDVTQLLEQLLKNSSLSSSDVKIQINNIRFEQCSMSFSISSTKLDSGDSLVLSTKSNFKLFEETRVAKNPSFNNAGLIRLYFTSQFIETQEFKDGRISSLTKTINITVKNEDSALTVSYLFDKLGEICRKDNRSSVGNEPSLKETAGWIKNSLEQTLVVDGANKSTKYESINFTQCEMAVREVHIVDGERIYSKYGPNLETLQKVKVRKNGDGVGGVTLEFSKNFDKEFTFADNQKELYRENKIVLLSSEFERSKRIGAAFTRLLELCGKETKEPF